MKEKIYQLAKDYDLGECVVNNSAHVVVVNTEKKPVDKFKLEVRKIVPGNFMIQFARMKNYEITD